MTGSLYGVLRADLKEVDSILIYGSGIIGLGAVVALRAAGFNGRIDMIGLDRYLGDLALLKGVDEYIILPKGNRERAHEIALRTGATVQRARFGNYMLSGGYDLSIDCIGSSRSVTEVLKWTRARGQIVMLGTLQTGFVDLTPLWFRELTVIGAYGRQFEHFGGGRKSTYEIVHDWIREGKVDLDGFLTHTFRLEEYKEALKVSMHKTQYEAVKVVFDLR